MSKQASSKRASDQHKRVVIYTRLSDFRGVTDTTTSPQRQREACEKYATDHGWTLVEVIEDTGASGSTYGKRLDRPGLIRARELFGQYDALLFYRLDRLARSVADFHNLNEEMTAHGVGLVSVSNELDMTSAPGRAMAGMLAVFAQFEAEVIATRIRESIAARKKMGRYVGGRPIFGYRRIPNPEGPGTHLEVHPEQAQIVREISNHVLDGQSVYSVANDLTDRGVKTTNGRNWDGKNLRTLLTSESLLGRAIHRGEVLRHEDDGMPIQFWDPVLDLNTFQRLQATLTVKNKRERKQSARLLSGLLTCGLCGQSLYANGSTVNTSYSCPGKTNGKNCVGVAVTVGKLDPYVTERFLDNRGDWLVYELTELPQLAIELVLQP